MLFNSPIFLFYFLPAVVLGYAIVRKLFRAVWAQNLFLLLASLFFIFWSDGKLLIILLVSIIGNFIGGLLIDAADPVKKKLVFVLVLLFDLGILGSIKYAGFLFSIITPILPIFLRLQSHLPTIALPLGISFYTFSEIAYAVDIYRRKLKPEKNLLSFSIFVAMFPKIVQGPIARFEEVEESIDQSQISFEHYYEGVNRFIIGLAKKVIIANTVGTIATALFTLPQSQLSLPLAWLGILCYTFQIYFDFSGYTDMAIGLGLFFGFHLPENFDLPYTSKSITEFWRRWHITLSRWLRDYLYIPLGGNRKGNVRTYLNLLLVFLLCGLWHGAAWTFVVWGGYYGVLLIIERYLLHRYNMKPSGLFGNLLTFFLVTIGWVFFRSDTISGAFGYLSVMFHLANVSSYHIQPIAYYLQRDVIVGLLLATVFSFVSFDWLKKLVAVNRYFSIAQMFGFLLIFVYALVVISKSGFTPFLYFKF